jgi:hypothetical protein
MAFPWRSLPRLRRVEQRDEATRRIPTKKIRRMDVGDQGLTNGGASIVGIFDRLFRRRTQTTIPGSVSVERINAKIEECQRIVRAYGDALLSRKSMYADASDLPYSKSIIKEALVVAMMATKDKQVRDQIMCSFLYLADWQDGIGPGPHDLNLTPRPGETIQERAKRFMEKSPAYMELSKKVVLEMQALFEELKTRGFWDPTSREDPVVIANRVTAKLHAERLAGKTPTSNDLISWLHNP